MYEFDAMYSITKVFDPNSMSRPCSLSVTQAFALVHFRWALFILFLGTNTNISCCNGDKFTAMEILYSRTNFIHKR